MNISYLDGILLDLGVSSMQLDDKSRGFSFEEKNAPLDMRMDQSQSETATDILNYSTERELTQILKDGEEKYHHSIAKNIVKFRKEKEIKTVGDLINILAKSTPKKSGKTHFATDTFRALRLKVNQETNNLEQSITDCVETLNKNGRIFVITFHSIEDRIIKNTFRKLENPCTCPPDLPFCHCGKKPIGKIITKKAIVPTEAEIQENPRSRSSKLRIFKKI